MKRPEEQMERQRRAALRSGTSIWTASLALIVVGLLIIGFRSSAPPDYFYKGGIAVAIVMLVLRQLNRRSKGKLPKAAQPDPKSTLKLS